MTILEMIEAAMRSENKIAAIDALYDSLISDTSDNNENDFDDISETVPADVRYSLNAPV